MIRRLLRPRQRPPNEQAKRITGRPYLSHSQLSAMRACPRRFAFQYVEHAPPDFIPSSLLFGAAVHAALELHYRCLLEGLTATPEALISAYHSGWHKSLREARPGTPVRFNKGEDIHQLSTLAERVIAAFLASPLAYPAGQVVGVEEELTVTVSPELPDVLAKLDLVYHDNDALHVVDFKTSRSRWTANRAEESSGQLLLYGKATEPLSNAFELPVRLHFAVVTKARHPAIQTLDVPADPARFAAVQANVAETWEGIRNGRFEPEPSPATCCLCPFKSRCPVFRG